MHKMKIKIYNSPEFSLLDLEASDIITTSDIEAGVETTPGTETPWYEENDGIWEMSINP